MAHELGVGSIFFLILKAVEKFYSVAEVSLLVSLCTKTVLEKLHAREFGTEVVNLGTAQRPDYRIPACGINAWLAARRVFSEVSPTPGIAARSIGELRRKVRGGRPTSELEAVGAA